MTCWWIISTGGRLEKFCALKTSFVVVVFSFLHFWTTNSSCTASNPSRKECSEVFLCHQTLQRPFESFHFWGRRACIWLWTHVSNEWNCNLFDHNYHKLIFCRYAFEDWCEAGVRQVSRARKSAVSLHRLNLLRFFFPWNIVMFKWAFT